MLDKKGNSNSRERIDLLEEFFEVFPEAKVDYLTAEREFIGAKWVEYLLEQRKVEFRIRVRKERQVEQWSPVFESQGCI